MKYNEETMKSHAIYYERAKDRLDEISQYDIDLLIKENRKVYREISSVLKINYVNGQPYETAEEMTKSVNETGIMSISLDHNNSLLFPDIDNLKFRAVHDFFHIITGQPFGYVGEALTYESQKMKYSKHLHPILFSEIVLQAAYCDYFGSFPEKQKIVLL